MTTTPMPEPAPTTTPEQAVAEWMRKQGLRVGVHLATCDVKWLADTIRAERSMAWELGVSARRALDEVLNNPYRCHGDVQAAMDEYAAAKESAVERLAQTWA